MANFCRVNSANDTGELGRTFQRKVSEMHEFSAAHQEIVEKTASFAT